LSYANGGDDHIKGPGELGAIIFGVAFALYFLLKCKAMIQATLSRKNQIVVPREARQALGVKPGDKLLVVVRGPSVIILQKPSAHQPALRGLGKGLYNTGYLEKERQSWD
jgi:AbrB family looped-hinge helix DNA binding protein